MASLRSQARREDRITEGQLMYPVFCTASIPSKILDEFIDKSYEGCFDMIDGDVGASPCILTTTNLDSITHGSRKPMRAFKSPFLGKSDNDIRTWMKEHKHPDFAEATFTILDEDTIKNKTCRVGYLPDDDRMVLADFYANISLRVPIEVVTMSWHEVEFIGTDTIYTQKHIEDSCKES